MSTNNKKPGNKKSNDKLIRAYNEHKTKIEKYNFQIITTLQEWIEGKNHNNKKNKKECTDIVFVDENGKLEENNKNFDKKLKTLNKKLNKEDNFHCKYKCPKEHIVSISPKTAIQYIGKHIKEYEKDLKLNNLEKNGYIDWIDKDYTRQICKECFPKGKLDRYRNFRSEMESINYKLLTRLDDFVDGKTNVSVMCPMEHITIHTNPNLWHTKIVKFLKDGHPIPCIYCSNGGKLRQKSEIFIDEIKKTLEERKLEFICYNKDARTVEFGCPKCNENQSVYARTIQIYENWRGCSFCNPNPQAYTQEEADELFKYYGCKLIGKYKNNTIPCLCTCKCGRDGLISLKYLRRDRFCYLCKIEKRVKSYIDFYQRNYGVNNAMQVAEIFEKHLKSMYTRKEFIFPTGEIIYVLGYENLCLQELVDKKYKYEDIFTSPTDMPKIMYFNLDLGTSRYYPDIYIPKENLIIEVKSTYTYLVDYEVNILKAKACIKKGFKYQFWIYDKYKKKCYVIDVVNNKMIVNLYKRAKQLDILDSKNYMKGNNEILEIIEVKS